MNPNTAVKCQCGCGKTITPKRHHKFVTPRFISGHNTKIGANLGESGHFGPLPIAPPEDVKLLLTGLCGCGCGQPTPIASQSRPEFQQYSGYPIRFIRGHHSRLLKPDETSRWKGGRIFRKGYVLLKKRGHPMADVAGYVQEHRFVMSEHLGRVLERHEHVHHKNGDRADNRLENLELLLIHQHPIGQRAEDLVRWAREILSKYDHLFPT